MCHGLSGLFTYGLNGHVREVRTPPNPLKVQPLYLTSSLE